jgi:acyl-CoA thioesterase
MIGPVSEDNGGFTELVGTELSSTEEGRASVSLRAEERHLNPGGTVHGGVISTLIDVSMAEALNTMTEEGEQPFTIQITVNYMKPGKLGTLTSTAAVRKGGERITVVEAEVVQEDDDEAIALATGTYTPVG